MKAMVPSGKTRKPPESFEECESLRDVFFVKGVSDEQKVQWAEALVAKSPSAMDERPFTPMHDAALSGSPALISWVFGKRPELLNANFFSGVRTPLYMACWSEVEPGARHLLKLGADPKAGGGDPSSPASPMEAAIAKGWRAGVEALVEAGVSLNEPSAAGRLPFVSAAAWGLSKGPLELAGRLVELGADPNGLTTERSSEPGGFEAGCGALHVACEKDGPDRAQRVRELLALGCDPNLRDGSGRTPLSHALRRSCANPEIAALLLARGADPWIEDMHGFSPAALSVAGDPSQSEEVAAVIRAWVEAKELTRSIFRPTAPNRGMSI